MCSKYKVPSIDNFNALRDEQIKGLYSKIKEKYRHKKLYNLKNNEPASIKNLSM